MDRLSEGHGFARGATGIDLICPACGAMGVVPMDVLREKWAEQVRRDRLLWMTGIDPDDPYRP
ncbi:hypothetical protein C1930_09080 [Stenotrophomonas sp. SAU14A_NAIMI4_8]|nr:hypothetical protein C1931_08800 [Stenotrophomonas sp. YAU14A_MKIMI4_1]AWH32998.1 hypothetical protein C1930_09080 [Stenotrophomonas sp. SAU14A_NAIMI4_8]